MPLKVKGWVVGLILMGVLWRWHGVFANRFFEDEALFSTWARLIALWRDPFLLNQAVVDTPPLLFYIQAAFYGWLGGDGEWVGRLPNFLASLLLMPILGQVVWQLYRDELATVVVVALVAFSPVAIAFSGTAYRDPLWVVWVWVAVWAVTAKRAGVAGFFYGLALLTKYQAGLFLPFLVGLAVLYRWQRGEWLRVGGGLLPGLLGIGVWDWARVDAGTFALQLAHYSDIRLAYSWELWERLAEWGTLYQTVLGVPALLFGLFVPLYLAWLIQKEDWATAFDQLFLVALVGYFLLHWLVAIPIWSRYLLPAVPLLVIVIARLLSRLWSDLPELAAPQLKLQNWQWVLWLALLIGQMPAGSAARLGQFSVGGQPTADSGASQIGTFLANAPYGTVLYDHWYSWHWGYYFLDKGVYVSWFAQPEALVEDLRVFGQTPDKRYLVLPADVRANPVHRAINQSGFQLELVLATTLSNGQSGMALYLIHPLKESNVP